VSTLPSALSESEIDQLAARLAGISHPKALTLEAVDGLFCALIASPDLVAPSEYLPVILGGNPTDCDAFADLDDASATMSLLMKYWNSVIADFERESIHYPYLVDVELAGIPGRDWARGYLKGTRLAPAGWRELWNKEDEGHLIAIPLVAGELDADWPKEPLTKERSDELLQWMIAGAARAYRHFQDARGLFVDGVSDEVTPLIRRGRANTRTCEQLDPSKNIPPAPPGVRGGWLGRSEI
jgi:uncharacterized protein